ncbi:hypothetical protein HS088_TW07G01232 [Tripterygium wilfordii]|uniref:Protein DA1-like domain-containing protein n=1 Tax=Tripterygium wilfordii TaxID=458696 RepID=A0A7J7DGY7_TRIWF|nr:hypothetical protein HS088_TW07G01232 [Tripterygium wilfordii]
MEALSPGEIADISRATELSLQEYNNTQSQDDEDIELAKAVEESLQISNKSRSQHKSGSSSSSRIKNTFKRRPTYPSQIICDVCDEPVSGPGYGVRDYWNQTFCINHQHDGTPICFGCKRLESRSRKGYVGLGDGRTICPDCYSTAILDTTNIKVVVNIVLQFFEHCLGMDVRARIPVFSVDRKEMDYHSSGGTTVGIARASRGGNRITLEKEHHQLFQPSRITILILFGLPKIMTGAVLAHEFMHAWLRLQGVGNLEPKIEEGICQVIAYKWLEWIETMDSKISSSRSEEAQYERNLKNTFKHEVEMNSSHEYGEGFRDAGHAVAKYGLAPVINHIHKHGSLPG